jgi:hypothetical protein
MKVLLRQSETGELVETSFRNVSCVRDANGSVSVEFGPLPNHSLSFRSLYPQAITHLLRMLTYADVC